MLRYFSFPIASYFDDFFPVSIPSDSFLLCIIQDVSPTATKIETWKIEIADQPQQTFTQGVSVTAMDDILYSRTVQDCERFCDDVS